MSDKGHKIWEAAKHGNKKSLAENLIGATSSDLNIQFIIKTKRSRDPRRSTALMMAARNGHREIVLMLIAAGAGLNDRTYELNETALMWAASGGHTATVQVLLEAKANAHILSRFGWTALMFAAAKGHTDVVKLLIEAEVDVNTKNYWMGETALMWAAAGGHTATVQMLLEAKADANAQNNKGDTALMWASEKGHTATVQLLLKAKARVNLTNKMGETALMFASSGGHIATVHVLLQAHAEVAVQDWLGRTAVDLATVQDMKALLANYVASKLSDPAAAGGAYPAVVTALMGECDTLKTRAAQVQPVRDALLQRDQLQSEYDVVFTANTDFRAVARLGKALKAAVEVVAQLPMSEEDYLALAGRHAALVERVTTKCRELAIAQDFDSLDALAIKLEELKALRVDVSALPQSNPSFSATDEQDGEGEDWINDPVMPDPEHLVTGPQ